ncbi:ParB/RepB/Spo0J family partition protein [Canibacter oris]|uniref:ParB family chromosome partitioning protein n=1 Tax=Canibacter oris TaxID=1365628 RepID=A0A840DI51_9MICO|nr:ParB/RepB/Spo0J family partition protein [Canibacter oris]MBB4071152.1 ParB family chromosome partitioning protein [Canibacter oris]
MASKKRSGLGRGIGALIPQVSTAQDRPVDVFFPVAVQQQENSQNQSENLEKTESGNAKSSKIASSGQKKSSTINPLGALLNSPQTGAGEATFSGANAKNAAALGRAAIGGAEVSRGAEVNENATGAELREVPGAVFAELPLQQIIPNRVNPRKEFEQEALQELIHSIKEFGVFQPIVVREIELQPGGEKYEIIMGERRFRASGLAGLETIPVIIRSTADEDMLRDALLENLHRADLNPLEEASAYQQLMDDFQITQDQLAARIGRSRSQISNTIRLLKLPEKVQMRVAAGVLSAGHARAILAVGEDTAAMEKFADKIVNLGLNVREAEAAAKEQPTKKRQMPRAGGRRQLLDEIAERLGDRFDTRVNIKLGAKKGQVVFEFATIADLNRILEEMGDSGFKGA